jgi:protein JSN1
LSGLGHVEGAQSVTTAQQLSAGAGGVENYRSPLVLEMVKNGVHDQVLEKGLASGGVVSEQQMVMQVLSAGRMNEDEDVKAAAGMSFSSSLSLSSSEIILVQVLIPETRPPVSYYTTLPPPPGIMRRSDIARLKELRRRLDSGQCTLEEINQITVELMGECAEVSHLSFWDIIVE